MNNGPETNLIKADFMKPAADATVRASTPDGGFYVGQRPGRSMVTDKKGPKQNFTSVIMPRVLFRVTCLLQSPLTETIFPAPCCQWLAPSLGPLMGGPQCHMSILRNGNVACFCCLFPQCHCRI